MWQSLSIIRQAMQKLSEFKGAEADVYHADVPEYYLPKKQDVYTKMEALIWHFKIIMGEIDMPKGEVYHSVEGANGELGFYLISDGSPVNFLFFGVPTESMDPIISQLASVSLGMVDLFQKQSLYPPDLYAVDRQIDIWGKKL